jgi:hypothetical protein
MNYGQWVRMPFGKHKGKPLSEVPEDYLWWCLRNFDWSDGDHLRKAICDRLGLDEDGNREQPSRPDPAWHTEEEASRIIKEWRKKLALDFHPDRRGGNSEAMAAINEGYDRLVKALNMKG